MLALNFAYIYKNLNLFLLSRLNPRAIVLFYKLNYFVIREDNERLKRNTRRILDNLRIDRVETIVSVHSKDTGKCGSNYFELFYRRCFRTLGSCIIT